MALTCRPATPAQVVKKNICMETQLLAMKSHDRLILVYFPKNVNAFVEENLRLKVTVSLAEQL